MTSISRNAARSENLYLLPKSFPSKATLKYRWVNRIKPGFNTYCRHAHGLLTLVRGFAARGSLWISACEWSVSTVKTDPQDGEGYRLMGCSVRRRDPVELEFQNYDYSHGFSCAVLCLTPD